MKKCKIREKIREKKKKNTTVENIEKSEKSGFLGTMYVNQKNNIVKQFWKWLVLQRNCLLLRLFFSLFHLPMYPKEILQYFSHSAQESKSSLTIRDSYQGFRYNKVLLYHNRFLNLTLICIFWTLNQEGLVK